MERMKTFWMLFGKDQNILDAIWKGLNIWGPTWKGQTFENL